MEEETRPSVPKTVSISEWQRHPRQVRKWVETEPVTLLKRGQPVAVMVSVEQ